MAEILTLRDMSEYMERQALDAELKALINRFGAPLVKQATKELCKGRRGRKQEKDWLMMREFVQQDAEAWLDGKDPQQLKSNNAIANAVSQQHPGHNQSSTHRRLMGKLAKRREWMFMVTAWQKSETERPYRDYFRATQALADLDVDFSNAAMKIADMKMGTLTRYFEVHGEPPDDMTIKAICDAMERQPSTLLSVIPPRRGLLGQTQKKP